MVNSWPELLKTHRFALPKFRMQPRPFSMRMAIAKFLFELEKVVSADNMTPSRKLELFVQTTLHTIRYKDGLLFEYLFDDQHLHLLDKLMRQGKNIWLCHSYCGSLKRGTKKVFNKNNLAFA